MWKFRCEALQNPQHFLGWNSRGILDFTGTSCIDQASLDSRKSAYLCWWSAGVKDVWHHHQIEPTVAQPGTMIAWHLDASFSSFLSNMLLVEVKLHHLLPLFFIHILFLGWHQKVWPRLEVHSHNSKDWVLVGSVHFKWFNQEKSIGQAWWHTPLITAFRWLRQMELCEVKASLVNKQFLYSQRCAGKAWLEKTKRKKKEWPI